MVDVSRLVSTDFHMEYKYMGDGTTLAYSNGWNESRGGQNDSQLRFKPRMSKLAANSATLLASCSLCIQSQSLFHSVLG